MIYFFNLQSSIREKYKIFSFRTTIRPKIRFLINSIFLFAHDHSTKVRGDSYSLIYSFINCTNISFALFLAVLPLHFVSYTQSSTPAAFIFCTLAALIYSVRYILGYMKSLPGIYFFLLLRKCVF